MVKLTQSLEHWLWRNHQEIAIFIILGHTELFTAEMQEAYIEWCKTDEGRQYLKGGSKYTEVAERRKGVENSPVDCSTPNVTDQKGEGK